MKIVFIGLLLLNMTLLFAQQYSTHIIGPSSGVTAASMHPQEDYLIVGSAFAGIFKSFDEGLSWESSSIGYPILPSTTTASSTVSKFVFDPKDPNIIYICSGLDDTGGGIGIMKTIDGGKNWFSCNDGIPMNDSWISDIGINPRNTNELFAVGNGTLYKSINKGEIWSKVSDVNPIGVIVFDKYDSLRINSISKDGQILESTDGGNTFQKYSLDNSFVPYIRFTCFDSTNNDLYFSGYQGLYKISDWRKIEYLNYYFPYIDSIGGAGTRLAQISCNSETSSVFVSTNYGVFRSTDRGLQWELLSNENFAFTFCYKNKVFLFSGNGVEVSGDDGENWNKISEGPSTSIIKDIDISGDNKYIVAATDKGIYISDNAGKSWYRKENNLLYYSTCVAFDPANHLTMYVGLGDYWAEGDQQGLFKSIDGGESWIDIAPQNNLPVTEISIHPNQPETIYIGSPGLVWKSTNRGESWRIIQYRSGANETEVIKIAKSDTNLIFSTSNSNNADRTGIFYSNDSGENWIKKISGFPYGVSYTGVTSLAIHPEIPNIVLAGNWADGIYKSINSGDYWQKVDNFPNVGFFNNRVLDILFDPTNLNKLYATVGAYYPSEFTGLYKSTDLGDNWEKMTLNGIVNNSFNKILFFTEDQVDHLILGTFGGGIAELTSPSQPTSVIEDSLDIGFRLSQNYPNPFNPTTTIEYSIPKREFVTLKIFDILGREMQTLVNEIKNSGNYKVEFDASNFSSGIYFYKLKVNNYMETKKLLFIK